MKTFQYLRDINPMLLVADQIDADRIGQILVLTAAFCEAYAVCNRSQAMLRQIPQEQTDALQAAWENLNNYIEAGR